MTFGRSGSDPYAPSTVAGQTAGPRPDEPYRGPAADGFGGYGRAPDGFGAMPVPLAAGQAPPGVGDEAPVTHAELEDATERSSLVNAYGNVLSTRFDAMHEALNTTCGALEVRRPKRSGLLTEMVNLAASAALAGAAGVVAEILARRLSSHVMAGFDQFKQAHQRFSNDAIKEHLKKSFHIGLAVHSPGGEAELAIAFRQAQFAKMGVAKRQFFATFPDETGKEMVKLPAAVLREMIAQALVEQRDEDIVTATAQQVAVEWANLVARVNHGAGDWDPWAGEHGSAHGVPTADAAPPPDFAHRTDADPSKGNVDPDSESVRDAVDDDQRVMNPTLHGVLEINLWGDMIEAGRHTRFRLYERAGHGMRLGGVSDRVKTLVAGFPSVRELKMNKVVAIYDNDQLNPPKPVGRFLITADGYIRRTSTDGGEIEMTDAAEFAQALSPSLLR